MVHITGDSEMTKIDATKIGLSGSLNDALIEYGKTWAENEASVWADQHYDDNELMPEWIKGTLASVHDAIEGQLDSAEEIAQFRSYRDSEREEVVAAYEDLLSDAEAVIDAAAAERWAELATEHNKNRDAALVTTVDIDLSEIGRVTFLTPPKNQGQTVEYSYAGLGDGRALMRVHDRSDRSTRYYVADLSDEEIDDPSPVGLNNEPGIDGDWVRCKVRD